VVVHLAALDPVVPGGGNRVYLTPAMIAMAALTTLRHTVQIEIKRNAGVGAKLRHQVLPLATVGPNSAPGINLVHNKVRHFMGHCVAQVFLKIFAEYPGVVANKLLPADDLEHPCCTTFQVKEHGHPVKASIKDKLCLAHVPFGHLSYLALFYIPDGLDQAARFLNQVSVNH